MIRSLILVILTSSGQSQQTPVPKLALQNQQWVAVFGTKKFYAPVAKQQPKPTQHLTANYRKDDVFVVWDSRGLSLRRGSKVVNTRLESLATDGRWFDRMQIAKNQLLLEYGGYVAATTRLLAHRRFGNEVFLLVRWESPQGTSWFDGLVRIDLTSKNLSPVPLVRFSRAELPRNTETLPIAANSIVVIDSSKDEWSAVRIQLKDGKVSRKQMGTDLEDLLLGEGNQACFIEETRDGAHLIGWLDLNSFTRSNIYETKGEVRSLDSLTPWIGVLRDDSGMFALSLETGAKLKIGLDKKVVRIGQHVVLWSGGNKPLVAELYESTRWRKLAEWKAPAISAKPAKRP
jgi:hypothetical protein